MNSQRQKRMVVIDDRLMVEVMKPQRQKKCIRAAGKSSALRWKTSQALLFLEKAFHFLDRIFLFLDLDCLTSLRSVRQLSDLGNEKLSLGKETSPSSFSISEQPASSSTEHLFFFQYVNSRTTLVNDILSYDAILKYFIL